MLSFSDRVQLSAHHHGAAELVIALDRPFATVLKDGRTLTSGSLLIPAGVQHQNTYADATSAVFYFDSEGRDHRRLVGAMTPDESGVYQGLPCERRVRETLICVAGDLPDSQTTDQWVETALFGSNPPIHKSIEPRIAKVTAMIKSDYSQNFSVSDLADAVHMSHSRLLHLFSEQVGIPIRKYRAWLRVKRASQLYLQGHSFTHAAHATGFSDASHFTKTFQKLFGTQPRKLLSRGCVIF
ncbi:MAG: AraC family transcriptional regulator [Gammaproteobacteria bacterium]|nr:AraC family transcriptional regulator [Gammaproteobacteria bacterium]